MRRSACVLTLAAVLCTPICKGQASHPPTTADIRHDIDGIIKSTIERSTRKIDGVTVVSSPILPTQEDLDRVRGYGKSGLDALSEYATSGTARQQEVALRLVGQFKTKQGLDVLGLFAEKSPFAYVRATAVAWMPQYPMRMTRTILERIAANDRDSSVRKEANRVLQGYRDDRRSPGR